MSGIYRKRGHPRLVIDLFKLKNNINKVQNRCRDCGVEIAGVIKGCTGLIPCVEQFAKAGCRWIASSRLEQLARVRNSGIQTDLMMIRVPGLSEAEDVVRICDYSLNSELVVLEELNRQAREQDKLHKVILMADIGDLREGFWDKEEMLRVAMMVEKDMKNLELAGVGTNVGCYGSVVATSEKLQELVDIAEDIENHIGRELEIISGGATTSLMRVWDGDLPERINMLRVGEGILLARDLKEYFGYDMDELFSDVFTLRAEVIEVKDKPSHPVGEIGIDAFGHQMEYEDRGIRRRALLALGKVDFGGSIDELLPRMDGIEILGASSDHTILDIQDLVDRGGDLKVGDVVEFDLNYATMVYLTNSDNIEKAYI
ncbi:MAG: alanine racemase [Clostridiales bacterium]|nr:alanine racemase [Clostridiales bacterium]MDD7035749.1 alanine racemase [Bacillota bacterium]MDY2920917.1 alanine racemase [Lentihominibacter sp.]